MPDDTRSLHTSCASARAASRAVHVLIASLFALALVLTPVTTAFAQDDDSAADLKAKAKKEAKAEAREKRLAARRAERKAAAAEKKEKEKEKAAEPVAPTRAPTPGGMPPAPGVTIPVAPGSGPAAPTSAPLPEVKAFETGLPYEPTSPRTLVTFNLEDATLTDLVRLISQLTGRRFILPGTTRAIKATVYAPTKVTAAEAYQAFMSILELNGMAVVPAGRYLKIVESGRVEGRPIPLYTDGEAVPDGDRFVTRLQRVNNISSEDAAKLLERFKSGDGSLTAYAPTNMLIITDTGTNIARMLRILEVIDVTRTGEQIWVEPVHYANANEIAERLSEIFEPGQSTGGGGGSSKAGKGKAATPAGQPDKAGSSTVGARSGESRLTKIMSDERTNSLIIIATERAYLRILEMLKYLDVAMEGSGHIHVHHLQHTDAEEIANTLQALVSGKGGGGGGAAGAKGAPAAAASGASVFEGNVAITAHKGSNALVITSSAHDYAALRTVIDVLDSERRQVFIEAVIMELGVKRDSNFGIGFHGGIPTTPTNDSVSVLGFQATKTIFGLQSLAADQTALSGLAVGVQGPMIENSTQLVGFSLPGFGVAINALAASGDANILSTPHLIATDNVEAEISVGQNIALQSSAFGGGGFNPAALAGALGGANAGAAGGLGGLAGLAGLGGLGGLGGGALPRQDVGTTVTITPHINDADEIRLQIAQEISSAGAPSAQGQGARDIDRTRAKTEVVVRDQQTVVIGGLMRDEITTGQTKVPVLGDIPLIGALFRSSQKQKIKKNLILFLTPYIIRSPADLRAIYERKMRERQEFLDRYFVFGDSDYEPPMDYSRTRGLIGEMLLELGLLDEKRKLLADAASRTDLGHDAKAAVGQAPEGSGSVEDGDVTIEPEGGAAPEAPAQEAPPEPAPPPEPPPQPTVVE